MISDAVARSVPDSSRPAPTPTEADVLTAFRGPPDAWLDVGPVRVAYRKFGRGPDVLFIHGWPVHSATYRRLVPLLAGEVTCHLIDLPGTGATECPDDYRVGFESHAALVRGVIDELELKRVALVAHDSGGLIARMVAAEDARVVGLVIAGSEIPGHRPALFTQMVWLLQQPWYPWLLRTMLRLGVIRRSALGYGGCFRDGRFTDGDFRDHFVTPMIEDSRVAAGQLRLVKGFDWRVIDSLRDVHAKIRVPVQMIWGSDDAFFPARLARDMAPQFGGPTSFHEIIGAKLFAHEDHAAEFAAHAKPFLRDVLRATKS